MIELLYNITYTGNVITTKNELLYNITYTGT